jgi:hypothetical protein
MIQQEERAREILRKEILDWLNRQIENSEKLGEPEDEGSWNDQEGILLCRSQAREIVKLLSTPLTR